MKLVGLSKDDPSSELNMKVPGRKEALQAYGYEFEFKVKGRHIQRMGLLATSRKPLHFSEVTLLIVSNLMLLPRYAAKPRTKPPYIILDFPNSAGVSLKGFQSKLGWNSELSYSVPFG
jgi:hypothetical protein